ncbi:hypothetical protein ERJ75_001430800 [Trypanosoma vivax]|nr:hypothetical protein TRVL_00095 [Trypanosoma vivax]KAH8607241.1 hypothetical protein ERJ75_001430800 [Trypanosoma vivax]
MSTYDEDFDSSDSSAAGESPKMSQGRSSGGTAIVASILPAPPVPVPTLQPLPFPCKESPSIAAAAPPPVVQGPGNCETPAVAADLCLGNSGEKVEGPSRRSSKDAAQPGHLPKALPITGSELERPMNELDLSPKNAPVEGAEELTQKSGLRGAEVLATTGAAVPVSNNATTEASGTVHVAEEGSSHDGSSIFSTLSQHLTKTMMQRGKEAALKHDTDETHPANDKVASGEGQNSLTMEKMGKTMGSNSLPFKATAESNPADNSASSPLNKPQLPSMGNDPSSLALSGGAFSVGPHAPITLSIPAVDSLRRAQDTVGTSTAVNSLSLPPLPSLQPIQTGQLPNKESALGSVPPPLPPRETPHSTKIAELRETSEAVERLVRAFALLRGHSPLSFANTTTPQGATKVTFVPTEIEKMSSLRQDHGVGDAGTVRTFTPTLRPLAAWKVRPNSASVDDDGNRTVGRCDQEAGDPNKQLVAQMNEEAIEEAILSLVMELLQQHTKAEPDTQNGGRPLLQPVREVVSMDNFRYFPCHGSRTKPAARGKVAPLTVFGGGMQAFAPDDAEAAESLYHSILEALQKYVWTHVDRSLLRSEKPLLPPITAPFAVAIQLDLLHVCLQIIERRLNSGSTRVPETAVWIQYDGPRDAEQLARNAVHCLPFEALEAKMSARSVFRLEYWVTSDSMWTVTEALLASIRAGVVKDGDGYCVFNRTNDIRADPKSLFPTRVPFFSLLPPDASGARCREGEVTPSSRKALSLRRREARDDGDYDASSPRGVCKASTELFHIEPSTLQSLAHVVSTVSTDILEGDTSLAQHDYKQSYNDATLAVSEAICELLNDAGIRAAVQRRAKAKMTEVAERREADSRLNRMDKERAIIAAAEAEAERVVQRILQELRVEEGRSA